MTSKLSMFAAVHNSLNAPVQWRAWSEVSDSVWNAAWSTLSVVVDRSGPLIMARVNAEFAWVDDRIASSHPNFYLFLAEIRQLRRNKA